MTIVAIVISPPQMALQVMLTTAKVVMAINHQNHRVLLMTVKVKIWMGSERQDSAADESSDSDNYRKQFANGANYRQSKPGFCRRGDAIVFEWLNANLFLSA